MCVPMPKSAITRIYLCVERFHSREREEKKNQYFFYDLIAFSNAAYTWWMHTNAPTIDYRHATTKTDPAEFNPLGICN